MDLRGSCSLQCSLWRSWRRHRPALPLVQNVRHARAAVARVVPDIVRPTDIVSVSGSSTRFVEIRRPVVCSKTRRAQVQTANVRLRHRTSRMSRRANKVTIDRVCSNLWGRFALANGAWPMLETARIEADSTVPQECSSIGRAPVSKTGGRRFEPCHSCQRYQRLCRNPESAVFAGGIIPGNRNAVGSPSRGLAPDG